MPNSTEEISCYKSNIYSDIIYRTYINSTVKGDSVTKTKTTILITCNNALESSAIYAKYKNSNEYSAKIDGNKVELVNEEYTDDYLLHTASYIKDNYINKLKENGYECNEKNSNILLNLKNNIIDYFYSKVLRKKLVCTSEKSFFTAKLKAEVTLLFSNGYVTKSFTKINTSFDNSESAASFAEKYQNKGEYLVRVDGNNVELSSSQDDLKETNKKNYDELKSYLEEEGYTCK